MGIHDGHRGRARQEFLNAGLEGFSDIRALELLLFYSRPQGDVNPVAHALIDTFGSLSGVMDASPEDLRKVPGVGDNTVVLLKLVPALSRRYLTSRVNASFVLRDTQDLWELFSPYFFGARNEMACLASFDANLRLLGVRKLSEGGPNETDVVPRQIAATALSFNATFVVLAHNHTSGTVTPSDADLFSTRHLRQVLDGINVRLYDHVILTDDDMFSLRDNGYMAHF